MGEKKLEYVSSRSVAQDLDLKVRTVQDWCKRKKFKAYKLGREWRILKSDFEEWKKRNITDV